MNKVPNFSLVTDEMKIAGGTWATVSYIQIQACTSKIIALKWNMTFYLSFYASFFLKQT